MLLLHLHFHCPLCFFFSFPVYPLLDFLTVATQVTGNISKTVQTFALHLVTLISETHASY